MSELRFDHRVAVITGAGGGLGREYALLLASRGCRVVVNDLGGSVGGDGGSGTAAESVVREIVDLGGQAVAEGSSVATPEGGEAIVAAALQTYGRVDIVVNNAGILRDQSFGKMTTDNVDAVLDVHLRGAFFVSLPAWRVMREQSYGRIINTSSNSGLIGNFGQSNYGAAKMGIVGLTRVLAAEGRRHGVNVNAIAPAARTRMTEGVISDAVVAEALNPKHVAPAVAWLAHEECDTSGEIISAGAGRVARYFIGLTPGWFDKSLDPEKVRDHWAEIRSLEDFIVPEDPSEELDQIMRHWS